VKRSDFDDCPLRPYHGEIEAGRGRSLGEDQVVRIWARMVKSGAAPRWAHRVPAVPWEKLTAAILAKSLKRSWQRRRLGRASGVPAERLGERSAQ